MHIYAVIVSFFMIRWHFRVSTFHAVPAGGRGPMRAVQLLLQDTSRLAQLSILTQRVQVH
jgi:hypothetical protein